MCKVAVMDKEWMYKTVRLDTDLSFLDHVRKFVATVKKHRLSLGRELTLCSCNSCKNKLTQEHNVVQSHLVPVWFRQGLRRMEVSRQSKSECNRCIRRKLVDDIDGGGGE
jgi:hypothetical protein